MTDVSKLVEKLQSQLVMSMFSTKEDLYREQERQREQAAEALIAQQQRIEALDGPQDVAQAARVEGWNDAVNQIADAIDPRDPKSSEEAMGFYHVAKDLRERWLKKR